MQTESKSKTKSKIKSKIKSNHDSIKRKNKKAYPCPSNFHEDNFEYISNSSKGEILNMDNIVNINPEPFNNYDDVYELKESAVYSDINSDNESNSGSQISCTSNVSYKEKVQELNSFISKLSQDFKTDLILKENQLEFDEYTDDEL